MTTFPQLQMEFVYVLERDHRSLPGVEKKSFIDLSANAKFVNLLISLTVQRAFELIKADVVLSFVLDFVREASRRLYIRISHVRRQRK